MLKLGEVSYSREGDIAVSDEAKKEGGTEKRVSESLATLKELLDTLPKDKRNTILDQLMANIRERDKLKESLTETEKLVFTKMMKSAGIWLTELSQTDRAELIEETKVVAKMTEAEQEAFWKQDEAFGEAMSKAVPVVIDWIQKHFTKPQDLVFDPELAKKTQVEFCESIRIHGTEMAETAVLILDMIWEQVKESIEPLKSYIKIDKYLRILLGDAYLSHLPATLRGHLKARGVEKDLSDMRFEEMWESLHLPEKESWLETVLPTLDMIFEQRYGWPEGTARTKTIPELCEALDHAVHYDDLQKPSVWNIT